MTAQGHCILQATLDLVQGTIEAQVRLYAEVGWLQSGVGRV